MRWTQLVATGLLMVVPVWSEAQQAPPAWPLNRPSSKTASTETKVDIGVIRTLDAGRSSMICDMPDGQVTYDVSQAQVFDVEGKPQGAAASLHPGDKVRITYVINNGAKVSEVRIWK